MTFKFKRTPATIEHNYSTGKLNVKRWVELGAMQTTDSRQRSEMNNVKKVAHLFGWNGRPMFVDPMKSTKGVYYRVSVGSQEEAELEALCERINLALKGVHETFRVQWTRAWKSDRGGAGYEGAIWIPAASADDAMIDWPEFKVRG